jgi:hypothetical protein
LNSSSLFFWSFDVYQHRPRAWTFHGRIFVMIVWTLNK